MNTRVQVAVVGGGLVAQASHLPNLTTLSDLYNLTAIADPSRRVRDALATQYAPAQTYEDWRELLEHKDLEAVVVCSPHATHAEVVLAALDRGLHVLVEKPLCITVEDADLICERASAKHRVVQVGYMKRHSQAFASLLEHLPQSAEHLRLIDVVTYDPWMSREPFVPWSRMTAADDISEDVKASAAEQERRQVAQAIGSDDPESIRAFSYTFLACLVHDVNLIHGALDHLGIAGPLEPRECAVWGNGNASTMSLRLPGGAIWRSSWMLLPGLMKFEEKARFYFDDAVHEVTFPAPYFTDAPIEHRLWRGYGAAHSESSWSFTEDPFISELQAFHACITRGETCRTPPEQARRDLATLRDTFLRRDAAKTVTSQGIPEH